jgi:hypothetical protein
MTDLPVAQAPYRVPRSRIDENFDRGDPLPYVQVGAAEVVSVAGDGETCAVDFDGEVVGGVVVLGDPPEAGDWVEVHQRGDLLVTPEVPGAAALSTVVNLMPNPSAETDMDCWGTQNASPSDRDSAWSAAGSYSVHTVCTSGGPAAIAPVDPSSGLGDGDAFGCTAGDQVYIQVTVKGEAGVSLGWKPQMRYYYWATPEAEAVNDYSVVWHDGPLMVTTPGQETTLQWTAPAAPTGGYAFTPFWLLVDTDGSNFVGDHGWMDAMLLTAEGGPVGYFDGDTADGGGYTYSWTGTPHASTSIREVA